jgi:hypothetical protein
MFILYIDALHLGCGVKITKEEGTEEVNYGDWPWIAIITRVREDGEESISCIGSLVSASHVITGKPSHSCNQRANINHWRERHAMAM